MHPALIAREFPCFDKQVEASIQHFTDLSVACDCTIRGMPGAREALTLVLYKHRISIAAVSPPDFDLTKDVQINYVLHRVFEAMSEILAYERRVQAVRDCPDSHQMRLAREESLAEIHRLLLSSNADRIHNEISTRVLPVVKDIASAGLPAVSVAAPIYFMARAILWNVSPAFERAHEQSLEQQSEPYKDPRIAQEWVGGGLKPNLFLDLDPVDPKNPHLRIGYRPSSPRLALILASLESWPEPLVESPRSRHAPAPSSSMLPMVRRTLRALRDTMLPAFARYGKGDRSQRQMSPFGHLVTGRQPELR